MAVWKPPKTMMQQVTNNFGDGLNTGLSPFEIKDNELTYVRNMGTQDYPSLSVRHGRTFYSTAMPTITTPNAMGERGNSQIHVIDGNTWKYWNTTGSTFVALTTTLASTDGEFQDYTIGTNRYTIFMNGTDKKYWDGTSTALTLGTSDTPLSKIFTVHKKRIFMAKNTVLYWCVANDINDWTTLLPTETASGNITITRAKGDITAICEYNDKIIIFTENSMHELYGSDPSNYEIIDVEGEIGCLSNKSIVKSNKRLYFYWYDGIYEYNGGSPVKISNAVDEYFDKVSYAYRNLVVAGSRADMIYFAIPYDSASNNLVLTYDTQTSKWNTNPLMGASFGKWMVETGSIKDFVTVQNTLYGLDSTGGILNMKNTSTDADNGTAINYDFITKPFISGTGRNEQTLWDMSLLYNGATNATLTVGYSTSSTDNNSSSFNTLAQSSDFTFDNKDHVKRIIIPTTDIQNEPFYRLRCSGTGAVTFHRLEKNYRVKKR